MSERLSDLSKPEQEKSVSRWEKITSSISGPNGETAEIRVAVMSDGKARRINFWDIDNTLLWSEELYGLLVPKIFPEIDDAEELDRVFRSGFRLGNSYREWHRMILVFREGKIEYKDPEKFREDFILNESNRRLVDEVGGPDSPHAQAEALLKQYGELGGGLLEIMYHEDQDFFAKRGWVNEPLLQLLIAKARLGEVNCFMTANENRLAQALVRYSGLWQYGVSLATDETMVGGGKELAIPQLIKSIQESGISVPADRLTIVGDSFYGDLGSGLRAAIRFPDLKFSGILVHKNVTEQQVFEAAAAEAGEDSELAKILREMEVKHIPSAEIKKSKGGIYKFGKRRSSRE